MSRIFWCKLMEHPFINNCLKSGGNVGNALTVEKLMAMIGLDITVIVEDGMLDVAGRGKVDLELDCILNDSFMFYQSPNPSQYDGSWLKTFTVSNGLDAGMNAGFQGIENYHDLRAREDVMRLVECYALVCTNPGKGKRISCGDVDSGFLADITKWSIPTDKRNQAAFPRINKPPVADPAMAKALKALEQRVTVAEADAVAARGEADAAKTEAAAAVQSATEVERRRACRVASFSPSPTEPHQNETTPILNSQEKPHVRTRKESRRSQSS